MIEREVGVSAKLLATPRIEIEQAAHGAAIEHLGDLRFGPERFKKTVYRLRDGLDPVAGLGWVALDGERLVGSIRYWNVRINDTVTALLLGPLAVAVERQGTGVGALLVQGSLAKAAAAGHRIVVLVGDETYYGRFGFRRDLARALHLPGPVDEDRFLACELVPGALDGVAGLVGRA